jgi:hypothetical protein
MSKFVKIFAIAALFASALVMTPGAANAQHWHGGGGYHGGGHWRGGGWGPGPFWGWGAPYAYYGGPACGWHTVRVWRGHWALRRAWRCY